jgi:hypothetical protein
MTPQETSAGPPDAQVNALVEERPVWAGGPSLGRLRVVHAELDEANEWVNLLHRHHKPVRGHRWSIWAYVGSLAVGVSIVGRPVSRRTDHRKIVEVLRLCTDGTKNACSFLYSASARAALALGYDEIQTFILATEPGTSLKAAGWECLGETRSGDWNVPSRGGRRTDQPMTPKVKWRKVLAAHADKGKG